MAFYSFMYFLAVCLATTSALSIKGDCDFILSHQLGDSVKLTVNLTKSGFHRDLTYVVKFAAPLPRDIQAVLVHHFESGVYMDSYQLNSLRHDTGLQVLLVPEVDLEAPAYESHGFSALVYPQPDPAIADHLTATVPIHGRYHRPSDQGAPVTAELSHPTLLLKTNTCDASLSGFPHKMVSAPCSAYDTGICSWFETENLQVASPMVLNLPVGDKSLMYIVCCGTLFITVICNFILSVTIWKRAMFDFY